MKNEAVIAGGGFAGCECACALSRHGIPVTLYEMKPSKFFSGSCEPDALRTRLFPIRSSLLCTELLRGLMKEEMEMLGSVCVPAAKQCAVPAGGALAVDRDAFGGLMTSIIEKRPET
jgi:methylenetetrahydrofolate--tRNA-(uracil-5-)-methyltransferase